MYGEGLNSDKNIVYEKNKTKDLNVSFTIDNNSNINRNKLKNSNKKIIKGPSYNDRTSLYVRPHVCPNGDIRLIQATNFELESCKSNSRNSSHKAPRPSNLSTPSTMSPLFPPQDIRSVSSSGYLYPSEISSLPCNYNNNVLPSYHPNQNITRSSVQDKLGEPLRTSFIKRQIIHNVEQEYKNIPVRENLKKQGLFNRTKQAINALDHKLYNDKHT